MNGLQVGYERISLYHLTFRAYMLLYKTQKTV